MTVYDELGTDCRARSLHVALVALQMPSPLACDFMFTNHVFHHTKGLGLAWALFFLLAVPAECLTHCSANIC